MATSEDAAGLKDDVSVLPTSDRRQIITTDTLVEGVHFLSDDPIETVGQKLVLVNISDILAKGAVPTAALFNLTWPKSRGEDDLQALVSGLAQFIPSRFPLFGGDTTSTTGPMVLSLTLIGECILDAPVRRSGGKAGDDIWVTGHIGDAFLGLLVRKAQIPNARELERIYQVPKIPPVEISECVARFANASIDVSDGLLADVGHVAEESGLSAVISLADVPFSTAAQSLLSTGVAIKTDLLSGGDDYQTLFTAPSDKRDDIKRYAARAGLHLTRIGHLEAGEGISLRNPDGSPVNFLTTGWQH